MEVHVEVIAVISPRSLQRERERDAIAAMQKSVDISDGCTDFFAKWVQSCRRRFEAATGLTLIPDGDDEDAG